METITSKSLKRRIMYRVYLSFMISIAEHRYFWQGFLFGGALALFGRLVHVAALTDNVLSTPLRQLPSYTASVFEHAFMSGEFLTILATLVMLTVGFSFARAFFRLTILERSGRMA
jgi:F0F1-type ATP synthase assembly protein I